MVSRSLAALKRALVVDAAQGVEAQTVANVHLALKQGLTIIPIINKIDLPNADIETVKKQLEDILAIPADEAIEASAKVTLDEILEAIVHRIPSPRHLTRRFEASSLTLSLTDIGVVAYVRVATGASPWAGVKLMSTNQNYEIKEVGVFTPKMFPQPRLNAGDVGYFIANIKSTADIKIGDTLTDSRRPALNPLPGFQEVHPWSLAASTQSIPRISSTSRRPWPNFNSMIPLSSFNRELVALGFGFRCGFLGLLHMEIIQERLRREYNMDIIATYPSVVYEVVKTNGEHIEVDNPANLPDMSVVEEIREPIVKCFLMVPNENIGDMMQLVLDKRGTVEHTESLDSRVMITATLPLNEILVDFHDKIKTLTRGYGSMDYEPAGYREADLVKLEMLVNGESVDAFSSIVHRDKADARGRSLAAKLKEVILPSFIRSPFKRRSEERSSREKMSVPYERT